MFFVVQGFCLQGQVKGGNDDPASNREVRTGRCGGPTEVPGVVGTGPNCAQPPHKTRPAEGIGVRVGTKFRERRGSGRLGPSGAGPGGRLDPILPLLSPQLKEFATGSGEINCAYLGSGGNLSLCGSVFFVVLAVWLVLLAFVCNGFVSVLCFALSIYLNLAAAVRRTVRYSASVVYYLFFTFYSSPSFLGPLRCLQSLLSAVCAQTGKEEEHKEGEM